MPEHRYHLGFAKVMTCGSHYTERHARFRTLTQTMIFTVDTQKGELMINRETYCSDCDRSIYGKYHDCDVNIENDGKYVLADEKCYCKIVNGERAEEYPWERRTDER